MNTPNNGGPAFPTDGPYGCYTAGMSLRDWFAGQALAGMFAAGTVKMPYAEGHESARIKSAQLAYQFADAMLAAREGGAA